MNDQPASIREWLVQQSAGDVPLYRIARALGVSPQKADELLQAAPTAEALIDLNRMAQYHHLALANRVWPNCTWLAWETRQRREHSTIDLIRRVFGRDLLEYVSRTFGEQVVRRYWMDLNRAA